MKILVMGASGMAGHMIVLFFQEQGHDVTAFSRRKVDFCRCVMGDATNFEFLRDVVIGGQYDAIINAIGILNQDAENHKANAVLLNSYLPHFLSETTQGLKTRIIQMSTDCVFSGKTGRYSENFLRDGQTFYDRSKALGELENDKDLTFRNSIIGPDMNEKGIGLFNWFMKQEGTLRGYTKAIWTGVTTLTLAKAMEQAMVENLTGLYNLVNNEPISKYELILLFNKHLRGDAIRVVPDEKLSLDKSLVNNRTDFSFVVPGYEEMVIEMTDWIHKHRKFYPHYFR